MKHLIDHELLVALATAEGEELHGAQMALRTVLEHLTVKQVTATWVPRK